MEQLHHGFPELRCAEHKATIILVNPDFKDGQKNFFCSRCIAMGSNKDNAELMVVEDFINYIATPSGINVPRSEEAQAIASEQAERISKFQSHITNEQGQITSLAQELQNQYSEKCDEMVTELKHVLDGQTVVFDNFYSRFVSELQVDNEAEATIPKFDEIRKQVTELEDMEKIESFLAQIVKQKESWKSASTELRTLGKRTEEFYSEQIETIGGNEPSFAQRDSILAIWQTGLSQLIERVKSQSGCFNNLYEQTQGIVLNIQNASEVSLLTNAMVKPDTELVLNFVKKNLTITEGEQLKNSLAALTNLTHLTVTFDSTQKNADVIEDVITGVQSLTDLTYFHLNVYGLNLGERLSVALGTTIGLLTKLSNLQLELGMNELTSTALSNIVQNWGNLTQLRRLTIDAKYNKITDATSLATAIANITAELTHLNVSFGGYSIAKNTLTAESAKLLVRAIRHLVNITNLNLDLGYTGLDDASAVELSQSLKDLSQLKNVNLQLYSNSLEARGAAKIAKRLSKAVKLTNAVVNLNFNDKLRLDGARSIVSTFRQTQQLTNLELLLTKVGVDKENAIILKDDLTRNKLGSPFERVVVLF